MSPVADNVETSAPAPAVQAPASASALPSETLDFANKVSIHAALTLS